MNKRIKWPFSLIQCNLFLVQKQSITSENRIIDGCTQKGEKCVNQVMTWQKITK